MKIKLDENLPESLARILNEMGHAVHTTREEGLSGRSDAEVWRVTQAEERFLITQDLGFSDVRKFALGTHHGILLLRLHTPNRENLIRRVSELFRKENVDAWSRCLVVATENKVRVTLP